MQQGTELGAPSPSGRLLVLCKFGKQCHLERLRSDGLLHFEPQDAFARLVGDPVRTDSFEGADRVYRPLDVLRLTLSAPGCSPVVSGPAHLRGPLQVGLGGVRRHTCSFFAWTDLSAVPILDRRFSEFGGAFLIVTNTRELLLRSVRAAKALGLGFEHGLVEYFDVERHSGEVGAFRKPSEFAYQSEFRFVLTGAGREPFELTLDSLADISTPIFAAADFNRLVQVCEQSSPT